MTNAFNNLFGAAELTTTANARSLNGTAELTTLSNKLASDMLVAMDAEIDTYRERIGLSAVNNDELDKLIDELVEFDVEDASFLYDVDERTLGNILRSQQSKRSRTKGKKMTTENYRTLLSAAIAENILRTVMGKPKHAGSGKMTGSADYTVEQIEMFANNPDELRKAIRNVQSKKSIMKSKAGFSEADERWLALLKTEQQLKDLRGNATQQIVEVDRVRDDIVEVFGGLMQHELERLHKADAVKMLMDIMSIVAPEMIDEAEDTDNG